MSGALWATASGIGFGLFQALNAKAVRDLGNAYVSTFLQLLIAAVVLVAASLATEDLGDLVHATVWGIVAFALTHGYQPHRGQTFSPVPTSQAPVPTTTHDETASVPRIEQDDLLAHLKTGDVTIVDVRDADAFLASHIPGALHIPLARVEGEVPYLPKTKPIVTYCT